VWIGIPVRAGLGPARGQPFVALEPMAAPTNPRLERTAPLVEPGDTFTATFRLTLDQSD
jgi:galactose mutarotase-like enzyme